MTSINSDTRLTDALERELMAQAIEEQMRFKPGKALKTFFATLAAKLDRSNRDVLTETSHAAS